MNEKILKDKLKFFASVTTSITHEINNCLAIINESNGLMEDMLLMADQGIFTPEKFQELINKNYFQINRANNVIERLNRFSHSLDIGEETIESQSFLENMTALVSSITGPKKIKFTVLTHQDSISWKGSLFNLQFLLYLTMQYIVSLCQEGDTIRLILNCHPPLGGGRIVFTFTCKHHAVSEKIHLLTHTFDLIVKEQGAEVQISYPEDGSLALTLSFPETIV